MKSIQHFFNVQAFHPRFPKGQPSRAQSLHGSDLHLRGRLEDLHEAWRVAVEALAELAAVGATEGLTVRKILGASMGGKSKTSMSQKKSEMKVSQNRGTPSSHPNSKGIFHYKPTIFRIPPFYGNPQMKLVHRIQVLLKRYISVSDFGSHLCSVECAE